MAGPGGKQAKLTAFWGRVQPGHALDNAAPIPGSTSTANEVRQVLQQDPGQQAHDSDEANAGMEMGSSSEAPKEGKAGGAVEEASGWLAGMGMDKMDMLRAGTHVGASTGMERSGTMRASETMPMQEGKGRQMSPPGAGWKQPHQPQQQQQQQQQEERRQHASISSTLTEPLELDLRPEDVGWTEEMMQRALDDVDADGKGMEEQDDDVEEQQGSGMAVDDDEDVDAEFDMATAAAAAVKVEAAARTRPNDPADHAGPVFNTRWGLHEQHYLLQRSPKRRAADAWDQQHVRLPSSPENKFRVQRGQKSSKWTYIQHVLAKPLHTVHDLVKAIRALNPGYARVWSFDVLVHYVEQVLTDAEQAHLLHTLLPAMVRLALRLPYELDGPVPLLGEEEQGGSSEVTLSRVAVASLLANAFFCTFPRRNTPSHGLPTVNMNALFASTGRSCSLEVKCHKLHCILHYFDSVCARAPEGDLVVRRQALHLDGSEDGWTDATAPLPAMLHVIDEGTIEDDSPRNAWHADFANKVIGGGVLGDGCVQEEIRFLISPELLVTRLFTTTMGHREAVLVRGFGRYSLYTGYARSFSFHGPAPDTPEAGSTVLMAIDAVKFSDQTAMKQFTRGLVVRELNKAAAGLRADGRFDRSDPVSTGNWGCGVFLGQRHLKALLQLMAAGRTNRHAVVYFTYGDAELGAEITALHLLLRKRNINVGECFALLKEFAVQHHETLGATVLRRDDRSILDRYGRKLYAFIRSRLGEDDGAEGTQGGSMPVDDTLPLEEDAVWQNDN